MAWQKFSGAAELIVQHLPRHPIPVFQEFSLCALNLKTSQNTTSIGANDNFKSAFLLNTNMADCGA
jgi:hypothetical protein